VSDLPFLSISFDNVFFELSPADQGDNQGGDSFFVTRRLISVALK
jgi:hypothetical protein